MWMYTQHLTHDKLSVFMNFIFFFFSQVLPTLINKQGANLLREFVVIWSNYKLMARWLCRFFEYLDRFFIPQHIELESLNGISFSCFRDLVGDSLFLGQFYLN